MRENDCILEGWSKVARLESTYADFVSYVEKRIATRKLAPSKEENIEVKPAMDWRLTD